MYKQKVGIFSQTWYGEFLSVLFIILVSLTMSRFSEKMLISTRCIHDFMSNLIKKSIFLIFWLVGHEINGCHQFFSLRGQYIIWTTLMWNPLRPMHPNFCRLKFQLWVLWIVKAFKVVFSSKWLILFDINEKKNLSGFLFSPSYSCRLVWQEDAKKKLMIWTLVF